MNSNKLVVFLLNVILFVGIFVAIYQTSYLKYKNILNERKDVYRRFCDINSQLDDFENIQSNMRDQKNKMEEIFSIYENYYKTNDEIINSYKPMIEEFLMQHEVNITSSTIKQEINEEDKNKLVLVLSFQTTYDQLYQLLFDIERFSTVSDLKVSYLGDVSFKCSPNLYSQEINDCFSGRIDQSRGEIEATGYFKEISDKIIFEINNFGEYSTWKDLFPVPRNPLFPGYVKKKAVVVKKKKVAPVVVAKPLPADITLEGVMYENQTPIAIVDGKLLKVGSVHKGARLVKINKNNVDFEYYGKIYKVRMEN